jgi:hypothetical protein
MIIVHLDWWETQNVLRFKNLCAEKFGVRFQQDKAFRHQMFDALIAAVENIGR